MGRSAGGLQHRAAVVEGQPPQLVEVGGVPVEHGVELGCWHGHDPAVALSIYSDPKADELRAAGASLFG